MEPAPTPQINVSKIPGGAGIAGGLFAIISMVIFLIGIPALRYMLPAAAVIGCVITVAMRALRHETPADTRILPNLGR